MDHTMYKSEWKKEQEKRSAGQLERVKILFLSLALIAAILLKAHADHVLLMAGVIN